MKRVLLTGASGFIGRHCIAGLIDQGYEVHAVSTRSAATQTRIHWHQADLLHSAQITRLLEEVRPAALLHLAWYAVPGKYWVADENLRWLKSGIDLLQNFAECGGERAVMAGTCAEYDWRWGCCCEELTPLRPSTLYGVCKNALRQVAEQMMADKGISFAWGRIFHLYGPHEAASRFVPSVICHLLRGQSVACSDGKQVRDYTHVQDVADAFVALLASPVRGPVNIASGQPVTVRAIGETLEQLIGVEGMIQWNAMPARQDDPPILLADARRLKDEVGWLPKISLHDGLQRSVQWWRSALLHCS